MFLFWVGLAVAAEPCPAGVCALTLWQTDHADPEQLVPRERGVVDGAPLWVDLGDDWVGAELAFELTPGTTLLGVDLRVAESLSIAHEGPHLDLRTFRPRWTSWYPAITAESGRLALAEPPGGRALPAWTPDLRAVNRAIRREVRVAYGTEATPEEVRFWQDLAATCPDWRSGACSFGDGVVALRVRTDRGVAEIALWVPQGC